MVPYSSRTTRRAVIKAGVAAGAAFAAGFNPLARAAGISELPQITRPIPSTGEVLPVVGLGTNNYSVSAPEELASRREVLTRMPDLGGTLIDTARAYGESEVVIGNLLEKIGNRDRFFLASKTPIMGDVSGGDAVIEESFRRLRTDVIDLMQVHNLHGTKELLPLLRDWKAGGRIRYVGITTSSDAQYADFLEVMWTETLDFIQVDYSIANRTAAGHILPLAQERGVAVLINMPFGGRRDGNVFRRLAGRAVPDWAAEFDADGWPEFLLKYVVSHPAVTCAIPGTTRVSHLESNQRAGRGRLPDADMRRRMEQYWDSTIGG
jgi:aryl-alcohol dehydrogenase-like predicted oxidoreductase